MVYMCLSVTLVQHAELYVICLANVRDVDINSRDRD